LNGFTFFTMTKFSLTLFGFTALLTAVGSASTLLALTSFGGGDGWLAPADYAGSGLAGNTERNFAYNPATGNLVLVSRNGGNAVRTYNGQTGALVGTLPAPAAGYASADLNISAVGVTTDGQIFVSNLRVGTAAGTAAISVYGWSNEAAATPTASTYIVPAGLRLGDTMDAIGSGGTAQIVLGGAIGTAGTAGVDGFVIAPASALGGGSFVPTIVDPVNISGGSVDGAFRISVAFVDSDTVIGSQAGVARITDFSGSATSGMAPITGLTSSTVERHVDTIVIDGKSYLATLESLNAGGRNTVRVYELNGSVATFLSSANLIGTTSAVGQSNANGTGDIEWGKVTGDSATLYSLTTNYGIQAFTFQVPEPSVAMLGGLAAAAMMRRRRI
jgi:hypothetical protein